MSSSEDSPAGAGGRQFATTHWSLVLAARGGDSPQSRAALAELCAAYWYPLYAYVRRRGHDADEAQDLTQGYFARLLEKDDLRDVDRARGKFRSFLLASFQHYLCNEYDRARARKRGGGRQPLPLDFPDAEGRYTREPAHDLTPEKLFERRWALALLDQVLGRLREEMTRAGKGAHFEALKPYLTGEEPPGGQRAPADELGLSAGAVKVAVHRLRRRYRELLRAEIERTLERPEQVEEEIRDLFAALGG